MVQVSFELLVTMVSSCVIALILAIVATIQTRRIVKISSANGLFDTTHPTLVLRSDYNKVVNDNKRLEQQIIELRLIMQSKNETIEEQREKIRKSLGQDLLSLRRSYKIGEIEENENEMLRRKIKELNYKYDSFVEFHEEESSGYARRNVKQIKEISDLKEEIINLTKETRDIKENREKMAVGYKCVIDKRDEEITILNERVKKMSEIEINNDLLKHQVCYLKSMVSKLEKENLDLRKRLSCFDAVPDAIDKEKGKENFSSLRVAPDYPLEHPGSNAMRTLEYNTKDGYTPDSSLFNTNKSED